MRKYASTTKLRPRNLMQDDEEGIIYDEANGFDIPSDQRRKKSTFAPTKSKYIQHFPGGYKVESEVPAGTSVPFQLPMMNGYGTPFPGYASPYAGHPYSYAGYASPYPGYGTPYSHQYGNPYYGGHSPYHPGIPATQSYSNFMQFIDERDKMKQHLDKQTDSLNSLKEELESLKKDSHNFEEKVRHGQAQIIPITRSKKH
mmetsp:Transcript_25465/g.25242  ORF Transcript_25465/g.25242 Transcript_25465/m.25242 type:complete len:200 (-) Transcript_25465:39-638(-)